MSLLHPRVSTGPSTRGIFEALVGIDPLKASVAVAVNGDSGVNAGARHY